MAKPPSPLHLRPRMVAILKRIKLHGDPYHGEERKPGKTRARKNVEALKARGLIHRATEEPETYTISERAGELIRLYDLGLQRKAERQERARHVG
jgi:hypothetical protein